MTAEKKECSNCKYFMRKSKDEPCVSCWGREYPSKPKWEPLEQPEEIQDDIPKGSAANSEHYMKQEIQSIEVMQMVMTYEKFLGFLEGNIIKYSMRCGLKDDPKQEKTKIKQYKMWLDMARVGKIIDPRVHVYKEEDNKDVLLPF